MGCHISIQPFKMHITGNNIPFSQINLAQSVICFILSAWIITAGVQRLSRKCRNFFNKTLFHLPRSYLACSLRTSSLHS